MNQAEGLYRSQIEYAERVKAAPVPDPEILRRNREKLWLTVRSLEGFMRVIQN
jgi:hypothetical protein